MTLAARAVRARHPRPLRRVGPRFPVTHRPESDLPGPAADGKRQRVRVHAVSAAPDRRRCAGEAHAADCERLVSEQRTPRRDRHQQGTRAGPRRGIEHQPRRRAGRPDGTVRSMPGPVKPAMTLDSSAFTSNRFSVRTIERQQCGAAGKFHRRRRVGSRREVGQYRQRARIEGHASAGRRFERRLIQRVNPLAICRKGKPTRDDALPHVGRNHIQGREVD